MARCPKCRTQTALIPYEGVKIQHCGSCGGNWLTDAKLDLILARRDSKFEGAVAEKLDEMARESASTEPLMCITCGTMMKREPFRAWPEVQLDVCPRCEGIWFDQAELEKCQMLWEAAKSDPKQMKRIEKHAVAELDMLRSKQEAEEFRDSVQDMNTIDGGSFFANMVAALLRFRTVR